MAIVTGVFPDDHPSPILAFIRSLPGLDINQGHVVAGGAVRRIFFPDEKDYGGDVDIFLGESDHQRTKRVLHDYLRSTSNSLRRMEKATEFTTVRSPAAPPEPKSSFLSRILARILNKRKPPASTSPNRAWTVQVVENPTQSLHGLIARMDYTCCMVVTDGRWWIADERFFDDARHKRLVINNADYRDHRLSRLAKYAAYGFTPEPGLLTTIVSETMTRDEVARNLRKINIEPAVPPDEY